MLTPAAIENKRFSKKMSGYNVEEVDVFLDEITVDYESLYKENLDLKERIFVLEEAVTKYKAIEHQMETALSLASEASDELKQKTEREAQDIIINAKAEAQKVTDELQQKILASKYQYNKMQDHIRNYQQRTSDILRETLEKINEIDTGELE